jgi:CRISPR-associated exonuclease Cas4
MVANEKTITGTQINYYFICHTKLWLFSHHIHMEQEHDNVKLGKQIHDTSYKREHKEVIIDNTIAIDFIKKGNVLELHDIKKSKKMEKAHRWQLLYYIYYLNHRGVQARGVLDYPLLRKKTIVEPSEDDFQEVTRIINDIHRLCSGTMPDPRKKTICKKCSYQEFCFGDIL